MIIVQNTWNAQDFWAKNCPKNSFFAKNICYCKSISKLLFFHFIFWNASSLAMQFICFSICLFLFLSVCFSVYFFPFLIFVFYFLLPFWICFCLYNSVPISYFLFSSFAIFYGLTLLIRFKIWSPLRPVLKYIQLKVHFLLWLSDFFKFLSAPVSFFSKLTFLVCISVKFWRIGVPTRDLFLRRILKVCNLVWVEARYSKPKIVFRRSPVQTQSNIPESP